MFEADLDASGSASGLNYSLKYKITPMLTESYKYLGFENYFIVIRDVLACESNDHPECLRVIAQYYPSSLRYSEFEGTPSQLADNFASLVIRGSVQNLQSKHVASLKNDPNIPPIRMLDAKHTPETMEALLATAKGFEILKQGTVHPQCQTVSKCISLARSSFKKAILNNGERSQMASLGLALTDLHVAFRLARTSRLPIDVELALRDVKGNLSRALQSNFLRDLSDQSGFVPSLALLDIEEAKFGLELIEFIDKFNCARASFRNGKWGDCIEQLEELNGIPKSLRPLQISTLRDAQLYSYWPDSNAINYNLTNLEAEIERLDHKEDEALVQQLQLVWLRHACTLAFQNYEDDDFEILLELENRAKYLFEDANVESHSILSRAILYSAKCHPKQSFPDEDSIDFTIEQLSQITNEKHIKIYDMKLAVPLLREKKYDEALEKVQNAFDVPWSVPYINQAGEYSLLKYAEKFHEYKNRTRTQKPNLPNLETCDQGREVEEEYL